MTTTIAGITVTAAEYDRFSQISTEMLNSGRSISESQRWAACSIGIEAQFTKATAERNEYARLVNDGSVPVTLILN